jgi:hypothetical protein
MLYSLPQPGNNRLLVLHAAASCSVTVNIQVLAGLVPANYMPQQHLIECLALPACSICSHCQLYNVFDIQATKSLWLAGGLQR